MDFSVNFKSLGSSFPLPADIAKKHIKLASHLQLKVILCVFSDLSGIDAAKIAETLGENEADVLDALTFWAQRGVLESSMPQKPEPEKEIVIKQSAPSREDVIRRGMEDENLRLLLREAQLKFGRNLKSNESALLVSLYDDNGMDAPLILYLLQYAATKGKCNCSYINSTAKIWLKKGVKTVVDAEKVISESAKGELAWSIVQKTFGLDRRMPSEKEAAASDRWINEWNLSPELMKAAYDECVDRKSKFSFAYVASILESWHQKGYKTPADVKSGTAATKKKETAKKNGYAGYDLDLFEKMLDK